MATMQVEAAKLLHLLESQDLGLDAVTEIEALIKENLQSSREAWLLNGLVDSYMVSSSKRCMQILATVQEPHDKHLMDRIVEHIKCTSGTRLQALTLFAYIVRKQPAWLYQVARHSLMSTITKTLKTDSDVPVLMCGVLIIASITPIIPVAITSHLHDIFEVFSRLVAFNLRKPGNVPDVYLLHLQVGVYALFHRLYGMYPCNFLTYLRATYSKPENRTIFDDLIKPMLERVRMHPLLVTASKDKELAIERWRHKEVHDIMVECAKMSLDPIEGWSEESLGPVFRQQPRIPPTAPDMGMNLSPPLKPKDRPPSLQPVAEAPPGIECAAVGPDSESMIPPRLAMQDPLWSPSSVCGLSTPPPLTPNVTPSFTDLPPMALHGAPLTPSPCLTSHVDSPLPHDETESRRLAMLNTHLAVQLASNSELAAGHTPHMSVPPSPLKPDFTSEPPFHIHPMHAVRKINFDNPCTIDTSGVGTQLSAKIRGSRASEAAPAVTPAEEAVEDVPPVVLRKVKVKKVTAKPACGSTDMSPISDSIMEAKPHVPASSSVPSVSQLPQFIDSLDVTPALRDKFEAEDQEVSDLTQEALDDDSASGGSDFGIPSHLPPSVQMTAESVAAFMKQVNRIRFNSMNVVGQSDKRPREKQYSRSNSCPNLKDKVGGFDESTEDVPGVDDDLSDNVTDAGSEVALETAQSNVVMSHVTKVMTTIQTQTSVVSTSSVGSEGHAGSGTAKVVTTQQSEVVPETEAERFYRYLMGILLPAPSYCGRCGAVSAQGTTSTETPANTARIADVARSKQPVVLQTPGGSAVRAPLPSPGGVPIYTTMSPPEMLDRHILLGGDIHAAIPLTSQSNVNWTHFGGVPPADEVTILSSQLLLLHTQLMFERHKSELHAKRNRRLLGRTVKTVALEEQYSAMQDQLRLQENEIQILNESLRQQQQVAAELRASNDKHACDRQVLQKSHTEEIEHLRLGRDVLQSELRSQKEENVWLCKELKKVRSHTFCVDQELSFIKNKVGRTDELQNEVTRLTKELLLMGELQQKYQQRLVAVSNSHNSKPETQFVLDAYKAEVVAVRLCLDQKNTLLDSTRARLSESEDFVKQKELMLVEDKKLMDHLRAQHKGEIQALEEKYRAQKKIQLGLHAQILDLYGQVPATPEPTPPPCDEPTGEVTSEETNEKPLSVTLPEADDCPLTPGICATPTYSTPTGGATLVRYRPSVGSTTHVPQGDLTTPALTSQKADDATSFTPHSGSAFKSYQEQKLVESVSDAAS